MLGYLFVNISGSSHKSIFYWCHIDSLDELKENIELRYHIPSNYQNLYLPKDQNSSLTDELFQDLYEKRFDIGDLNFNLEITDASIDPNIVEMRRQFAAQRLSTVRINSKDARQPEILDIDFHKELSANSIILDVKNCKNYFMLRRISNRHMFFVYKNMILSDEHLLADLYLDHILNGDFVNMLEMNIMLREHFNCDKEQSEVCTPSSYYLSPLVCLFIPGMEAKGTHFVDNMKVVPPKNVKKKQRNGRKCLDPIGYTKLAYPLLKMHSFDVWTMKCWIKHSFGVPCEDQIILYYSHNNLTVCDHVILEDWAGFYRFYVFLLPKPFLNQSLKPFNNDKFKTMNKLDSIPVKVSLHGNEAEADQKESFSIDLDSDETIHEFIAMKYNVPIEKQMLFLNGRKISHQDLVAIQAQRVWAEILRIRRSPYLYDQENLPNPETPIELQFYVLSANNEMNQELSIVINRGFGESIFCQFPFSTLSWNSHDQYQSLCRLIKETHPDLVPEVIYLTHDYNDQTIEMKQNLGKLLANCLKESKNLVLNLFFNPLNLHTNVDEFCQRYDLSKEIRVNFLTGQFAVDLSCDTGRNFVRIEDLKDHIYITKGFLPHLQCLYHNHRDLPNDVKLFQLLESSSSLLNLVVKQPQEVEIELSCTFLVNHPLVLKLLETLTVLDIKERIKELSNVPVERMSIQHDHTIVCRYGLRPVPRYVNKPTTKLNDETPVWILLRDKIRLSVLARPQPNHDEHPRQITNERYCTIC